MTKENNEYSSICSVFENIALKYPDNTAIFDEYSNIKLTYKELISTIKNLASGMQTLGLNQNEHVCLFTENCGKWIIADQAILKCGCLDAVRGSNAPVEELDYIISHSDSVALILKDKKLLTALKPFLNKYNLKFIILLFNIENEIFEDINCPVYSMEEIIKKGKNNEFKNVAISPKTDATLIYTSGTTGNPKGVLLCHSHFISQVKNIHPFVQSNYGENTLQILPVWHSYERIGQYYYLSRACNLHFTTLSALKNDLKKYHIHSMMSVPRIWESIRAGIYQNFNQKSKFASKFFNFAIKVSQSYKISNMYLEKRFIDNKKYNIFKTLLNSIKSIMLMPLHNIFEHILYKKIRNAVGLNFRVNISGGGALKPQEELFYDAIGVNLRVGYGLTETSPVIAVRAADAKNYLCSTGTPIADTMIKILDPKTLVEQKPFEKGLVMVKGPQVMKGYYKNPKATQEIINQDGWLNTGDLGWFTNTGNLVLIGRIKETIVLSSGENIEPVPIEEACLNSKFIDQIVLVGQDKNALGALIVPSKSAYEKCGVSDNLIKNSNQVIKNKYLRELIKNEIQTQIKNKPNLRNFEKIMKFEILKNDFNISNGLMTSTAKIKRNKVFTQYNNIIEQMYKK